MQEVKKISTCHPDRKHKAKGFCHSCYNRTYWAQYYKLNKDKIDAKNTRSARIYSGRTNAQSAKRRGAKLQATPKWADLKAIKLFYINCPKGMEVDHIEPLSGKNVCGLHVLDNLQYLTPFENRSKGNR